ncbi:MAG: ATP-binding protein [Syntrophus sp. (in: bacteria)]|nr:ATP-binding protein [Syntrophus sp. (in: bacteria)]
MLELSLHILDIAENAVRAEAETVTITLIEEPETDRLMLEIRDDGKGMTDDELRRVLDPFYTTKKVRRVGLGLPMLAQAAEHAGGCFEIESRPSEGTAVRVTFQLSHIDRQPLGDLRGTMTTLIAGNPDIRFIYRHRRGQKEYMLDTYEIKKEIEDVPINHIEVLKFISQDIIEGLKEINAQA